MDKTNYNIAQLPDNILNDLRCSKCQQFLSCGPITILATTGASWCGRCYTKDSDNFRATAYEAVAAYFLFRCKNWKKHCAYLLNWDEILDHEDTCTFGSCCGILCNNPGVFFKSDNNLDFNKGIETVYNIPEAILEILTCSLCEYYLCSTPIFVSAEGKSVCHRCFAIKNQMLPSNFVRHHALEKILTLMLFPCVFRHRGCTKFFRFGSNTTEHEKECSYGQVQKKPLKKYTEGKKERGVIETHSGHTYGTITPNSQFFVAQEKVTSNNSFRIDPIKMIPNEAQGFFIKQLMNHRENLVENRWRNSKLNNDVYYKPTEINNFIENPPTSPTSSSYYHNYIKPNHVDDFYQRQTSKNGPITKEPNTRNDYVDEGFNSTDSDSRKYQSFNSESPISPNSPRSSVYAHSSPITLNPNDLDTFSNFDFNVKRNESVNSDGRNRNNLQYNGSFRN
ncbi:uncharacterized protein [Onthophagus taurus]|uniref:uncharacterized protein n=1 Tax=Onthophagus taurus TaxID=166361 RepID=UPI000C209A37|nr:uncharacterized protein LOC111414643 [Onthophagus taurus]